MRRLKSWKLWTAVGVILGIPVIGLAWWLFSPLLFDKTVEEEFPFASSAVVPPDMTRKQVENTMQVLAKMDAPMAKEEPMTGPMKVATALKSGEFADADRFHKGEGTATIYSLPDGTRVLRVESFRVTNGPDLRVILSPSRSPSGAGDVTAEGHAELGKLKGNIGNQNYPIPEEVDVSKINSVVIYCKPFRVIFSLAELR